MPRFEVKFEELTGDWGAQIGSATVDVHGAIPGLRIHRISVCQATAGEVTFGMPLLQGELPGSRYSGITFDTDEHRQRFFERLKAALRTAKLELFGRERQIPPRRDSDDDVDGGAAGAAP
jgi:hypothetical protein